MLKYPKLAEFLVLRFGAIVKKGEEFVFNCPRCGDTKRHFYFNLRLGVSNCFRCHYRPLPYEFLKENTSLTEDEIRELLRSDSGEFVSDERADGELFEVYEKGIELPEGSVLVEEIIKKGGSLSGYLVDWFNKQNIGLEDVFRFKFSFCLERGSSFFMRLIIPCWSDRKRHKMIYYVARSVFSDREPKYLYPSVRRGAVFWGLDCFELYDGRLFLCEGWKDAYRVKGLALLGNSISSQQVVILRELCSIVNARGIVVLLDRDAKKFACEIVRRLYQEGFKEVWYAELKRLKDPGDARTFEEVMNDIELVKVVNGVNGFDFSEVYRRVYGL